MPGWTLKMSHAWRRPRRRSQTRLSASAHGVVLGGGPRRDLRPAVDLEPPFDALDAVDDVPVDEAESYGDGAVLQPVRDQQRDVVLARSQAPSPSARCRWQFRRGINRVHTGLERRQTANSDAGLGNVARDGMPPGHRRHTSASADRLVACQSRS